MTKLNIDMWGRTWLQVGQLIKINFGSFSQDSNKKDDPATSGKYIITAIHHQLAPAQHKMTCQVVSDSNIDTYW
jgi:hypothetical protein